MQGWVSAINLAAALHSSEPMAGALGSSTTFSRPTIPIGPSNYVKEKQIIFLEKTIEELENDLERYSPDKLPLDQLKNKPKPWVKVLYIHIHTYISYLYTTSPSVSVASRRITLSQRPLCDLSSKNLNIIFGISILVSV